jgi:hypothetical protein
MRLDGGSSVTVSRHIDCFDPPWSKDACKNGGWRIPAFNQGIAFVNRDEKPCLYRASKERVASSPGTI